MSFRLLLASLTFLIAEWVNAGLLFSASAHWSVFAFRPVVEQDSSPNYYGLGPGLVAGYSLFQAFDAAAFVDYTPGQRGAPNIQNETASLTHYGLQIAMRLEDKVYLGIKVGQGVYHLVRKDSIEDEVEGLWQGPSGGLMLGAIHKEDKRNYWQLTLEFMHTTAGRIQQAKGSPVQHDRQLDSFKLSISYTYNDFVNHMMKRSILRNIL